MDEIIADLEKDLKRVRKSAKRNINSSVPGKKEFGTRLGSMFED